jgi:glycosyltransferase involved in cell wall biosynthesis
VENLDNQAVESWLLRVMRVAKNDYPYVDWTFFCVLGKEGCQDETARSLGAEVIHSRYEIGNKIQFLRGLREVMKNGNFDVLHCHHDIMSAAYLMAATGLPFRKRIVHVHNTSMSLPTPNRTKQKIVREPMRQMCLRLADEIVGISEDALESLTDGKDSTQNSVIHYAVDTRQFSQVRIDRARFRSELGFGPDASVLLFVGRLVSYKNPAFVIEVLECLAKTNPNAVAVFAGRGNQESELRETLRSRGFLADRVRLLGFRDNVADLMANSDVLIWPSLEKPREGLGLGIVEAQSAGLPIIMSRSVPDEAIVVPALVDVLSLEAGADAWAVRISEILRRPRPSREEAARKLESSSFSLAEGVKRIVSLYAV